MTARTLKDLYRIEQIDQATRIYGVAGNPIAHSLSPLMQNTAFHRERINAVYLPLKTERESPTSSPSPVQLPLSGLSVTMPLKQAVISHLANVDPHDGQAGSLQHHSYWEPTANSTDLTPTWPESCARWKSAWGSKALACSSSAPEERLVPRSTASPKKARRVSVWSRNESSASQLAASAARGLNQPAAQIAASEFDVLINATPCGMTGNAHPRPHRNGRMACARWSSISFTTRSILPLLQAARARGIATIQGVEMFVHQGARQFELWTGKPAPEAEMLRVVLFALHKAHGTGTGH
jgi:3-dehydroquinate dehydratase/shikimate dehydrogenase